MHFSIAHLITSQFSGKTYSFQDPIYGFRFNNGFFHIGIVYLVLLRAGFQHRIMQDRLFGFLYGTFLFSPLFLDFLIVFFKVNHFFGTV